MRAILAIVGKDLQSAALALVGLVLAYGLVALAGAELLGAGTWDHDDVAISAVLMPLITCAVLSHRLISSELGNRTWMFLGTLPVRKVTLLATKVCLGLVLLVALQVMLGVGVGLGLAERFALDGGDWLSLLGHYSSFAAVVWGVAVGLALLGRYRLGVLLASLLLFAWAAASDWINPRETPMGLIFDALDPMSPHRWHGGLHAVIWLTGGVGLAGAILGVRRGAAADLLAERMSYREKVTVAGLLFALMAGLVLFDERTPKEPFELRNATTRSGRLELHVRPPPSLPEAVASDKVDSIHQGLEALAERLDPPAPDPIFVTHRGSLDPTAHEKGFARDRDGLLVRTNLQHPDWSSGDFEAWVMQQLLRSLTAGRARLEDRRWAFDGLRAWWAVERGDLSQQSLFLRACYGAPQGLDVEQLDRWLVERERMSPAVAQAIGGSLLGRVAERFGDEGLDRFLASTLGTKAPANPWGALVERADPVAERFERATGEAWEDFVEDWAQAQTERCAGVATVLSSIPRLDGRITTDGGRAGRRVTVHLTSPLPDEARLRLHSRRLGALDGPISPNREDTVDLEAKVARAGYALSETHPEGGRVAWRITTWSEALECAVGTGWRREQVR